MIRILTGQGEEGLSARNIIKEKDAGIGMLAKTLEHLLSVKSGK